MFLKNWHQFENKLIVEVNDSFVTNNNENLEVVQIQLDKENLKVLFYLSGGKKISVETIYKNIKSKKYKHKSHRGFLGKLFVSRGDMYQNQEEVKQFLIEKLKNDHPDQYESYTKARDEF